MGSAVELDVDGRAVRLSSPDKVYFPARGYTKRDVAEYYLAVAPGVLRGLRDRPTTLQRFPDGVEGEFFYQKRAPGACRSGWRPPGSPSPAAGAPTRSARPSRPPCCGPPTWAV